MSPFEACIKCPKRKVLCSVGCPDYAKGKEILEARKAARKAEHAVAAYESIRAFKLTKAASSRGIATSDNR